MDRDLLSFFVSHAFKHDADRQLFHEHLQHAWSRNGVYQILEPSVRHCEHNLSPKELRAHLRQQIAKADVMLVAAASYALKREWILYEIRTAQRVGTPIILVRKPKARCPSRLVDLCGVHPTELDTLRWKITRVLPADRLSVLRAREIEQALAPKSVQVTKSANEKHNEARYPWLSTTRSIHEEWPKAG